MLFNAKATLQQITAGTKERWKPSLSASFNSPNCTTSGYLGMSFSYSFQEAEPISSLSAVENVELKH